MIHKTRCSSDPGLSNSCFGKLDTPTFGARKSLIMVGPARLERATNWLKAEGRKQRKPLTSHGNSRSPSNTRARGRGIVMSKPRVDRGNAGVVASTVQQP